MHWQLHYRMRNKLMIKGNLGKEQACVVSYITKTMFNMIKTVLDSIAILY